MGKYINKKAHGIDTILSIVVIFGLGLLVLFGIYVYDSFVDNAENTTLNDTPQAMAAMQTMQTHNDLWDYVILVVFIGFIIAMMVLGYFVDVHTIFFPLFIIVMLVGVLIAAILSYIWDKIANHTSFTAITSASLPITSHLMDNLVIYYVIAAGLALIATYAKTTGQGE